jgi:hypothetical protein
MTSSDETTWTTISCRLTREQQRAVATWAERSGCSISEYVRDSVFASIRTTAEAQRAIRDAAYRQGRDAVLPELLGLRAQLDQARHNGDLWQQRAETLERDLRITSVHLLFVVVRVLGSDQGARAELARLWSCLEPSERQRMLPAVTAAIVERLHQVLEEMSPGRSGRERDLEVVANAVWLITILLGRGDEETPESRQERVSVLLVAARAHISITQRGTRLGRSRENPPPMSKVPAAKDADPAHGGDDLQQPLTEAPQRDAASGEGADHDPYIGPEDRRPTPTLEGEALGLGIPASPQTVEQLKSRAGAVSSTDPTQIAELDDDHLGPVAYGAPGDYYAAADHGECHGERRPMLGGSASAWSCSSWRSHSLSTSSFAPGRRCRTAAMRWHVSASATRMSHEISLNHRDNEIGE